jgi:hypothetical protein
MNRHIYRIGENIAFMILIFGASNIAETTCFIQTMDASIYNASIDSIVHMQKNVVEAIYNVIRLGTQINFKKIMEKY